MTPLNMKQRKFHQRMKNATGERFWSALNILFSRSYAMSERHYGEAMDIVLTPSQKAAVIAKATEIRELWDGLDTITMDNIAEEELVNGNVRGSLHG